LERRLDTFAKAEVVIRYRGFVFLIYRGEDRRVEGRKGGEV